MITLKQVHLLIPNIVVTKAKTLVGRSRTCDVSLPQESVSRKHAEIVLDGPTIFVSDLQSRNGTFVDGKRIQSEFVRLGQKVQFGTIAFIVGPPNMAMEDEGIETESAHLNAALARSAGRILSPAQARVFRYLLQALSEKEVAARLCLSPHTVHKHVERIYSAFGVHSRSELITRILGDPTSQELND
jgi:DNA-binding CsgD family transcriptional regulator